MKAGTIYTEAVSIRCPYCTGFASEPLHHSTFITADEWVNLPDTLICSDCDKPIKKPSRNPFEKKQM